MRHLRRLGHCVAAGAFAGAILAPLQLLLWPELHIGPLSAALVLGAFASWAAAWVGGVLFVLTEIAALPMPYLGGQRGFSIGLWRWLALVVGAVAAMVAWYNRGETRDLLLPEFRHALTVAGSMISLYTLVILALAIRRRPRRNPVARVLAGTGALVVGVWGVWATTSPPPALAPPAALPRFATSHRLLFVTWEGADLPWLLPAIERGDMPFLRSVRDRSAWGQLRAVHPHARPAALATLVTGCSPAVHGVLGRRSYHLYWLSQRPVTLLLAGPWPAPQQLPWKAWEHAAAPTPQRAALWQILAGAGLKVGIAGWPGWGDATWTVAPPDPAQVRPAMLDADLRAAIEPALRAAPMSADAARTAFAIDVATVDRVARQLRATPVDALVVDLDLPARLRPAWTIEEPGSEADEVLRQAARQLDAQLKSFWQAMGGEDTLTVIASPYGMAPPSQWQRLLSLGSASRSWHVSPADSPDGFALFWGPGIRPGARLRGGHLPDVAATVLYLLELPVARDMAGRVLLEAVSDERAATAPLRLVPSYPREAAPAP